MLFTRSGASKRRALGHDRPGHAAIWRRAGFSPRTAVSGHEIGLRENMPVHLTAKRVLVYSCRQLQRPVERKEAELVSVRSPRGRSGSAISDVTERVPSLDHRARAVSLEALGQAVGAGRYLVHQPVDERGGPRRVGIFHYQSKLSGPGRHIRPGERGCHILPVGGVFLRYRPRWFYGLAPQLERHWISLLASEL
jgi:hypothetical protein